MFVEQIIGSIDIECFKCISLCIEVIVMVCEGVDFIEVFCYFCDVGQNLEESFVLVQCVFRGVLLSGGLVFIKDMVYLCGLVLVYMFFWYMLVEDCLQVCCWLFVGKMSLIDVIVFVLLFEVGVLKLLCWLLYWVSWVNGLVGMLVFLLFVNWIWMDQLVLE